MESKGGAQMIYHNICTDVMHRIPIEEENMIGTDSAIRYDNGKSLPHPRGWGTFPRFIRYFVNEKKMLSLDDAIYRMTGLPSEVFKLSKRGKIKEGYFADLVLFNAKSIRDEATYDEPFLPPKGIRNVIVNGEIVFEGSKGVLEILDIYPGRFLKRGTE